MPAVSMKYFQDHVVTSVFNNQATLAKTLEQLGMRALIESNEISPLTVRLFNIKSGLDKISDVLQKLVIQPFPRIFLQQGYYNGPTNNTELYGTIAASGSLEYVHSYITPKKDWSYDPSYLVAGMNDYRVEYLDTNNIRLIREDSKVHSFNLHCGIYDFFANLDSAFDRLRLELNSIYLDGKKELDASKSKGNRYWALYLDPKNNVLKTLNSNGFNSLTSILTGALSIKLDGQTGKYRNRLIHDGDLEIKTDLNTGIVYLPDDPLSDPLTFGTVLLPFISQVFSDVQILFRDIYAQVILDINSKNKIPLV